MENTETTETTESYVSDQLAVKTWSVIARDLHEGASVIVLHKAWDSNHKEFIIFPSYAGQDPDAIRPDVWMSWRHELKPPMAGHTRIRDFAEVVAAIPLQSASVTPDRLGREHRRRGWRCGTRHRGRPRTRRAASLREELTPEAAFGLAGAEG